jgi:signal transduction histidine kinase
MRDYVSASWDGQMNDGRSGAGAVLFHGRRPVTSVTGYDDQFRLGALPLARARLFARVRLSWLQVICAASVAVLALAFVHPVAYHLPALRASTEGASTILAVIGALLFRAQFASTRRLRDLVLLAAMVAFALLEFSSNALPAALDVHSGSQFAASLQLGQLFVALGVAVAASIPSSRLVVGDRRPVFNAVVLGGLAFLAAELGGAILGKALIAAAPHPVPGIGHALGQPLAAFVVIGAAALLFDAAARFARRARVEQSDAMRFLAGAVILLAVARLYYLAIPWVSPNWITSREFMLMAAFGLIVAAAAREELDLRAGMARAAAIAERLRVARDLHDGLSQDLAFIAAHGARMAGELGAEHPLAVAAGNALAVSRGTISDLSDTSSATPRDALEAVADELRARFGIAIAVDAGADAELSPDAREELLRIAREAITNAARHGHAKNVIVSLARAEGGLVLQVRDDGSGIFAGGSASSREGFGIHSMRERTATLNGSLTVIEHSRGGTELRVVLP